ncbi:protein indeterminate-domain 5, chloroplastic isoform X1 [Carica papaya]|uniref:protein indeterminate-domain 5, chloroplastic isoform X1 n=1 Tax=Carica papaya TaxID=3649 RepID=UPI000B8C976E|nr:protein indeterminate-domain 5, chloroplastic isoform X1 [Carica papaya]
MAASSSSVPLFGIREENQNQMRQQQHSSTPAPSAVQAPQPPKKKRNQPGTPNPDAEVIALSPKTLMATNRFICEVCNKGFQREQNLQLHRRGHNLPWKLKQKTTKEVKRKVYLCPDPTCVHHDPSRALGDLTGIKKHYSRKHGEKKWKCEKCSKRYAVQSDWKAHSKTCGTREYRCDCGTLFSRRDSFITHRAFCDALAQESARHPPSISTISSHLYGNNNNVAAAGLGLSQLGPQVPSLQDQTTSQSTHAPPTQFDHLLPSHSTFRHHHQQNPAASPAFFMQEPNQQDLLSNNKQFHGLMQMAPGNNTTSLFNLGYNSSNDGGGKHSSTTNLPSSGFLVPNHFNNENGTSGVDVVGGEGSTLFPNNLMTDQISSGLSSLFGTPIQGGSINNMMPHMSATALLQKAAQMGSTSSNNTASLLRNKSNFASIFSENEANNLHELMNSFSSGSPSILGGGYGEDHQNPYGEERQRHGPNTFGNLDEQKLHQNMSANIGGSDRLTRDFLGVGQIVRSMSGGISQREKQQQATMDISSLESERNRTGNAGPTTSQSFGGGGNFQ